MRAGRLGNVFFGARTLLLSFLFLLALPTTAIQANETIVCSVGSSSTRVSMSSLSSLVRVSVLLTRSSTRRSEPHVGSSVNVTRSGGPSACVSVGRPTVTDTMRRARWAADMLT